MLIPLRTDSPIRRTPYVNFGILAANVFIHLLAAMSPSFRDFELQNLVLDAAWPKLYQFFTYQFLHAHGSIWHLAGNMLFLWVFGNSVNSKMGQIPYLLMYLAGGVAAGVGFAITGEGHLLGASGSIAAITTAYLVLFPRSNIQIFYWFFIFGVFEVPSMIMIVAKIIVWDNLIGPGLTPDGASSIAYSAHLAGYAFGFVVTLVLLIIGALPRDQFDILALIRRWHQRRTFAESMRDPKARAQAQYGRVADVKADDDKVEEKDPVRRAAEERVASLRAEITRALSHQDRTRAADLYEQLLVEDPDQFLPLQALLDVANQFYTLNRAPQAAAAYERFLKYYPTAPEAEHIQLLLGIIYARDLQHFETAERYLRDSLAKLTDKRRREQCAHWLNVVLSGMGRPSTDS